MRNVRPVLLLSFVALFPWAVAVSQTYAQRTGESTSKIGLTGNLRMDLLSIVDNDLSPEG
jgi:hypothetical protein